MTKTKTQKARARAKAEQNNLTSQKVGKRKRRNRRNRGGAQGVEPGVLMLHGAQSDSAVSTFFRFKAGSLPTSIVVEGRDLAAVALSATSAAGAYVVDSQPLSADSATTPLCTRWGTWGGLFQKWRIRKLKATLVATSGTTTVGRNFAAFNEDPLTNDDPASAEAIMRLQGSAMGNAYSNVQVGFDKGTQLEWYRVSAANGTDGLAIPGQLHVATASYTAAVIPGTMLIDYELEFADPK